MRHGMKVAALAALLALAACDKSATTEADKPDEKKDSGPGITLSAEESQSMGLATARLAAASYRGQIAGYGMVLAADTVAQSDADLATAEAAAAQSQAAAARAQSLSTGADAAVSRETYEVAAAKAATDQAAVLLARRKADAAFGTAAPWLGANRAAILARLQSGRSVLVKVTFPIGANVAAQHLTISRLGTAAHGWNTATVWDAPADPAIPGRSLFALVDGSDLAQGERVIAAVPTGTPRPGVLVPASALVLGESDSWAYLKTRDNTYLRTRIDTSRPEGDGYFVAGGLRPGQEVVTEGAGMLYAHEVNPSTEPAD